jgi:hypothetical protein
MLGGLMAITKEQIESISQEQRHNLWNNAKRKNAGDLVRMIEASGLPYSDPKGLKLDSPVGREMAKIINSRQGIVAAVEATNQGLPALAGVDPLLQVALGDLYAKTYEATIQAGYLVALMMRTQGYENSGRQGQLTGCVAKTGEIYKKRG